MKYYRVSDLGNGGFYPLQKNLFNNPYYQKKVKKIKTIKKVKKEVTVIEDLLSDTSKIVYGILCEKLNHSLENGWFDEDKRIFVKFSVETLAKILNKSKDTIISCKKQLEAVGLIEIVKTKYKSDTFYIGKLEEKPTEEIEMELEIRIPQNEEEKEEKILEVENVDQSKLSDLPVENVEFLGVENVDLIKTKNNKTINKTTTRENLESSNYKNYIKEILKECGFESITKGTVKNILALSPTYDRLREVLTYVKTNEMGEGAIVKALRDEWVTREPKRRLPKNLSREDKISLVKGKLGMDRVKQIREELVERYKRYQESPSFDRHISRELDEKLCKLYGSQVN